jgi:glycerol-3-phosphate acyltransferase PlsX
VLPVALDVMGGDNAPEEILKGAFIAADEDIPVILVGPESVLKDVDHPRISKFFVSQAIAMDEDPALAVRQKKDSSIVRGVELVKDLKASAFVSAGNTGAVMAASLFRLGRIKNVSRPGIATPLPVPNRKPVVLIDAGANTECKSEWLVQFAHMGSIFSKQRFDIKQPKVALLSNGEEAGKGSILVKDTYELLSREPTKDFEFIGNCEGRDILTTQADVIVTDGFTGNVALKTLEGSLKFFINTLIAVLSQSTELKELLEKIFSVLAPVATQLDPETTGGAMLLGVKGVSVISHGSSSAKAIVNAIKAAYSMAQADLVTKLEESFN